MASVASVALAGADAAPEVEWLGDDSGDAPSVSIIIPSYEDATMVAGCLRTLEETVPLRLEAEFIVVDDGSSPEIVRALEALVGQSATCSSRSQRGERWLHRRGQRWCRCRSTRDARVPQQRHRGVAGLARAASRRLRPASGRRRRRRHVAVPGRSSPGSRMRDLPRWLSDQDRLRRHRPLAVVLRASAAGGLRLRRPDGHAKGALRRARWPRRRVRLRVLRRRRLLLQGASRRPQGPLPAGQPCRPRRRWHGRSGPDRGPKAFQARNQALFIERWHDELETLPVRPEPLDLHASRDLVIRGSADHTRS